MLNQASLNDCVDQPLVTFPLQVEKTALRVGGVTDCQEWLAEMRLASGKLLNSSGFPVSTIRKCAQIENAIESERGSLLQFYVWLASGCLTTAFIMTQRNAALRRIETSQNEFARFHLLPTLRNGDSFATVGFSHLTTSRRHLNQPPLRAIRDGQDWILDGFSPWVTGGKFADWLVVGAVELESNGGLGEVGKQRELLFCVAKDSPGIIIDESNELMALNASATGQVRFENVKAREIELLHGPVEKVMEVSSKGTDTGILPGRSSGAGGLQTSALAIGHAAQAIEYLFQESHSREDLRLVARSLETQWKSAYADLLAMDNGELVQDSAALRKRANDLALNSSQAALVAAKGMGFTSDHRVGRWCREAMFFLVWSCPQSVSQAHLCCYMT